MPVLGAGILCFFLSCQRKLELVPAGAKNVSRNDSTTEVTTEDRTYQVKLREYRFYLPGEKSGQDFVCVSREFSDTSAALAAARKSIAERPEEELKSERAHFAQSGRSLWLRIDKGLLWCMYAGTPAQGSPAPVTQLKDLFIAKFRGAT